MHRTPIVIKDLESHKIKRVFCSQTYVYVITIADEVKSWGEWLFERANEEFIAAGLTRQDAEDRKAPNQTDEASQDY